MRKCVPKMHRNTFGGLPDPLGELKRSPGPLPLLRGPTSNGGKGGREGGREGEKGEGRD